MLGKDGHTHTCQCCLTYNPTGARTKVSMGWICCLPQGRTAPPQSTQHPPAWLRAPIVVHNRATTCAAPCCTHAHSRAARCCAAPHTHARTPPLGDTPQAWMGGAQGARGCVLRDPSPLPRPNSCCISHNGAAQAAVKRRHPSSHTHAHPFQSCLVHTRASRLRPACQTHTHACARTLQQALLLSLLSGVCCHHWSPVARTCGTPPPSRSDPCACWAQHMSTPRVRVRWVGAHRVMQRPSSRCGAAHQAKHTATETPARPLLR
jgi:hypothetical protein